MAFVAIAGTLPQYEDFPNYWMQAYEQGTTTKKVMANDSAPTTTFARLELDAQGFPNTTGNARLIPFIDGSYDLWLFPTEQEAIDDNTSNAIQLADNITNANPAVESEIFTNVDAAQNLIDRNGTSVGEAFIVADRANGIFDAKTGLTANGVNILQSSTDASIQYDLRLENVTSKMAGADPSNSAAENTTAINTIIEELRSSRGSLKLDAGSYDVNLLTFWREVQIYYDGMNAVDLNSQVASGPAIEVGDATYRQSQSLETGWRCGGFTLKGNANADIGMFLCNVQADYFYNIRIQDFSKAGAYGMHITGNPFTAGESNPGVVIGAFYNQFDNIYVVNNTNGVLFTGVSGVGQANANSWYGGPIRQNNGINLDFGVCNDVYVQDASLEASGSTSDGVRFSADSNGCVVSHCRFEGTYTNLPWEVISGAVNAVIKDNYYGAYYSNNDPLNAAFSADSGTSTKIDEYRLTVGNTSTLVLQDLLVDEITAKTTGANLDIMPRSSQDVVFKDGSGTTICQFGDAAGQGGFRFTPLGLFYIPNGTTANRPSPTTVGAMYWDSTLSKQIWWNGSGWEDATGASV